MFHPRKLPICTTLHLMIYLILATKPACGASILQLLDSLCHINLMQALYHDLFLHINFTSLIILQSSPLLFFPQFFLIPSFLLCTHLAPHTTSITTVSIQHLTCHRFSILPIVIHIQWLLSTSFSREKFTQSSVIRRLVS